MKHINYADGGNSSSGRMSCRTSGSNALSTFVGIQAQYIYIYILILSTSLLNCSKADLIHEPSTGERGIGVRTIETCIDQIDTSLINQNHRAIALMLYNEIIRNNNDFVLYGEPIWQSTLSENIPEDEETNSVIPLIQQGNSSSDIAALLFVNSEADQHIISFVPVPDTLPDPAHPDSFDLRLVVELCHCYLYCETTGIHYRDGNGPECYDFSKRSRRKKFRRSQFEEEEGSGYGGSINAGEVTIIVMGAYGNDNWMFINSGQNNNGGGGGTINTGGFVNSLIDPWDKYYDCLSSSPELAQAIINKQFQYQGALQIINHVLDQVLDFMCTDLQGPYLNLENFNNEYNYVIQGFPFLRLYELLGYDHTQNDILYCLEFTPGLVEEMLYLIDNDHVVNACHPDLSPQEIFATPLDLACQAGDVDSLDDLYSYFEAGDKIVILPNLESECPKYHCIVNEILGGALGTQFLCDILSSFDEEHETTLNVAAIVFDEPNFKPNAYAAVEVKNEKVVLWVNTLKCNSVSALAVFETLQHELIHADIKRRLMVDHGWDGSNQTFQDAFFKLVYYEYGPNASFSEHELMLRYYTDTMVESLIEANGGMGAADDFIGLIYNGFPEDVLYYLNITLSDVYALYDQYVQFVSGPGMVNSAITNCD